MKKTTPNALPAPPPPSSWIAQINGGMYLVVRDDEGYQAKSGRYLPIAAYRALEDAEARRDELQRIGGEWVGVEILRIPTAE